MNTNISADDRKSVRKTEKLDLKPGIHEVLKTLALLQRPLGMNNLIRLLKGNEDSPWVKPAMKEVETFGAMKDEKWDFIRNLIVIMLGEGLAMSSGPGLNVIEITPKGRLYLEGGYEMPVWPSEMKTPRFDLMLLAKLRELRKRISDSRNIPVWRILPEITLLHIMKNKPQSYHDLQVIPGMGSWKAEQYGNAILETVRRTGEEKDMHLMREIYRKAQSNSLRETKELFLAGRSLDEIAASKGIKPSTAEGHLETLHIAGEINLKPWIEKTLDSKTLYKGAEYFRRVESPKMKEAYEVLGLDYNTLRLCRMYVSNVSSRKAEVGA